ncbi:hypothetical protein LAJ19_15270 (plasmid) [Deinococcus taeanensis]|uniref:hypothetical protein n=1 Tax=Deinococcus taeanensis TaxID=2737050 RepID=UPI001CDCFBA0|nr:hypothetical protein [Deinococcus taeanensis]UBV44164.1 hypothetical protein LAJ19_15270 [Deinococcus taeanensis]
MSGTALLYPAVLQRQSHEKGSSMSTEVDVLLVSVSRTAAKEGGLGVRAAGCQGPQQAFL